MGVDHEIRIVPSVLDRLIDLEPKSPRDILPTRAESIRVLRLAVQRDLDYLLNSRNTFADLSPDFVEARQSVLTYGLSDFTALNLSDERNQNRLRQVIETTIRTFEPRLTGVVATLTPLTPSGRATDPTKRPKLVPLRLHVDARLVMDPSPEAVAFDIVMPLHTGKYEVKERE
jgi:type VI secretion system protein ImpF